MKDGEFRIHGNSFLYRLNMHPHSYYRFRLLQDFLRILAVPVAVLHVIQRTFAIHLGLFTVPGYLTFIVLWAFFSQAYSDWRNELEAKKLGGRPVPKVKGKWPGNFDILLDIIQRSRTSYFAGVYRSYFEQYQTTTLNLNILWRDVVSELIYVLTEPQINGLTD